ncbi:MAG TPA: c-type cytochrome [Ignavibacteria bacterium]|nr:c-type cytochrome [Ignavibacteria bacterium]
MNLTKKTILIVTSVSVALISVLLFLYITGSAQDNSATAQENKIGLKNINNTNASSKIKGKDIYGKYCVACHGINGNGQGLQAYRLKVKPTDFTSGMFKFKSTSYGTPPTADDIITTLKLGVRTTSMLPQWQLSNQQMKSVAEYVLSFSKQNIKTAKPIQVPGAPEKSRTILEKGKKLFQSNCATCHGTDGKGDGVLAKSLKDYKQNPSLPANLTLRPLKRANTSSRLYLVIATGIEGTPMPPFQNSLKPKDIWAIDYYVQSLKSGKQYSSNRNGMGMMGGMMGKNNKLVGEENIGMQIDMAAGHAWMMGKKK